MDSERELGRVADDRGREVAVLYREGDGGIRLWELHNGHTLTLPPGSLDGLREMLDRAAMPGQEAPE